MTLWHDIFLVLRLLQYRMHEAHQRRDIDVAFGRSQRFILQTNGTRFTRRLSEGSSTIDNREPTAGGIQAFRLWMRG
jgi:hypothetical protein